MRKRNQMKKGIAALLSSVLAFGMTAGVIPEFGDSMRSVRAATGKPSVTAYATKQQMMDDTFAPDDNTGTALNYGKLVFGKNNIGEAQEWYILGKDEGVSGDNTIIFAASPIDTGKVFSLNDSNKSFNSSFGVYASKPTDVYPNHYGASELRLLLLGMPENTRHFTTAERGLMNATSVRTKDMKNDMFYITRDKLYALQGNLDDDKKLWAGTNDSTVLAMSSYWSNGSGFWLRSPHTSDDYRALLAKPDNSFNYNSVGHEDAVQPASNLNLSRVLFASAATAASSDTAKLGTIALDKAMTLRLDGTGKKIGTVTYNATTGDIKVVRGDTSQPVSLVVQGKDGTNDWYYSKKINTSETVNASDIKSALSLTSDIDLSACKIWLEITDSTENLTYAVNATEPVNSDISSVAITGIDTPTANTTLDTSAACATTGVSSTTPQITWTPGNSTAGYNTSYTASITLTADTGYKFVDSTTATINGNTATSVNKNTDGTLTVTYAFPATAKDKLTSITAPQAITVANGTAYSAMNLPNQVNIVTEGNTESSAPVTWDTTTPASGSYDPAVLTQQTVTLNGTVDCPDSIDANGVSLTTTITITISAAGIVGAPTANPTAGTYSENQSVALTSSTVGATIYYTTDGSEPTITGGTTKQYTDPILVTGIEGQSITTTIKAIAVKNGMQDNSSVETFTYTIQIPVAKYTVTVTNGSGTGQYAQGETVTITAGAAPSGQQFKEWEVVSGTITLASSTSETTTFTMPAEAVSVKANYEAIPVTGYTITATAGANGSISPSGAVGVAAGGSQTFTISPSSGYVIDTLKVDGLEVTATTSYTFSEVNSNHTIEVNFKQESQTPDVPDVTAPSITTQPGNATVKIGETATFTIAASGDNLTYQWQINRNNGKGFVDITGADKASYTTGVADMLCNGYKYQCVISNSAGSVTTNAATLTVTESTTPSPDPVSYKILDGANSSWTENTDGSLSIRGNGEMEKFQNVKVDGKIIDKKNYTVTKGSTIITLKADYLKTLATGDHTFEIVWTDGSATTKFTVAKNKSGDNNKNNHNNNKKNNSNNAKNNQTTQNNPTDTKKKEQSVTAPKTGDTSDMTLWTTLLIVSFAGAAGIVVRRNNKTCK